MAKKSIADRVYTAYLTGGEASFYGGNNETYEFTPEGLRDYIIVSSGMATVTQLDSRLSQAQRNAIDALTEESGLTDVIAALQAVE